ncbi:MAG: NAD(P)/FAD-dependent oxidoreductase [Myxococcales bacterium]|nr:NAD(P)/FAD-dependent oxidoreductase [Myxococcales bacterium]
MSVREGWDAIVIGSGLGGLTTAAYLCAAGKRTLVLEAHYVAGGNSQVFRRNIRGRQYEFDVGIHYIGECGRDGIITGVLNSLGLAERVVFRPLDPDGYSTLVFPDFSFRVPVGWDRYRARLIETFPDEADALTKVLGVFRSVADDGRDLARGEITIDQLAARAPDFLKWGLRSVSDLFREHGLSERASACLLGEQGDYAVRPSKTPVALQAGIADHFLRGAFYPEGGGQVIAGRLIEAIRAYGGEVRTRACVERIRVDGGRVRGVVMARDGEEIDAPVVISNADLKRTFLELVGAEYFPAERIEQIRGFAMATPLFVAYLGLDIDLAARGWPNSNYFIWGSYDIEGLYDRLEHGEAVPEEMAYVTTASLKDPDTRMIAPEGYTNLQIMTLAPPDYTAFHVSKGPTEGGRYHRDPSYRRAKNALMERLITTAEKLIPDIREHVDWKEAATPVSQERFTRSTGGTSYGIEMSLDQIGPFRVGPTTEVEGLYLCGASTPSGPGITGVMRSGLVAAAAVLETDLLGAVLSGEVLGDRSLLPDLHGNWDAWRESH